MRVLIAGRNAKVLATVAGTFVSGLKMQTATSKAAGIALLDAEQFDLVVACETLTDGSGLEVLSHVSMTAPNCLRIFAARPSTLILLKGELGLFGLFRTLSYPINMRKLSAALRLAQGCLDEEPGAAKIRHVVLDDESPAAAGATKATSGREPGRAADAGRRAPADAPAARGRPAPGDVPEGIEVVTVREVQLPARSAAKLAKSTAVGAQATATSRRAARQVSAQPPKGRATAQRTGAANAPVQQQPNLPGATATRQLSSTQRPAATAPAQPTPSVPGKALVVASAAQRSTGPARIQQTEAFKRALARRNAAKLQTGDLSSAFQDAAPDPHTQRNSRAKGTVERREPSVRNESLAQLAQLTTIRRSISLPRGGNGGGSKRRVVFVSTGVFAAIAAGVLTFSILSANNSIARAPVPAPASVQRLIPAKVFPWQAAAAQAPSSPTPIAQTTTAAVDAPDDADAPPETAQRDSDYSPPPPPNAPPPPAEPPAADDPDDE